MDRRSLGVILGALMVIVILIGGAMWATRPTDTTSANSAEQRLTEISTKLDSANSRLTALEGQNTQVSDLSSQVQALSNQVTTLSEQLANNDPDTSAIEEQLAELSRSVDSLTTNVNALLVAPPVASNQPPYSGEPPDGTLATCPTAPEASMLIAGNTTALVQEGSESCLFEWRAPLAPSTWVNCPDGWACELDIMDNTMGLYFFGGGDHVAQIDAGSFRLIAAYPADDPIHDPCSALANSRAWLVYSGVDPNWQMNPGNFTCEGETPPVTPPGGDTTGNACPATADEVVSLVGGQTNQWSLLNEGQWKRKANSPSANLTVPWGSLNWWDGHRAHTTNAGDTAHGAFEATWNCIS